jgi:hypothetical protein
MISLLVPSRGTPERLETMLKSVEDTVTLLNNIQIVLRLDDDDPSLDDYYALRNKISLSIALVVRPSIFPDMGRLWNECFAHSYGEILQVASDDLVYRTKDWDLAVYSAFEECSDKMLLVYGKDGGMNERLATHPFLHREWVHTVGYLTPPYALVYGNDDWIFLMAKELGRTKYLPDVFIEHCPVRVGNRMRQFKELSSMQVYSLWGQLLRQRAITKLKGAMNA